MENISQIEKLRQLQMDLKENAGQSNLDHFENLVGVYLGVEPKIHYPKLKDSDGNKVKDDKGNDMRSEVSDGWTYTFSEFGSSKQIKVVLNKQINFKLLTAYLISGKGYDIKSGGMYFLEIDTKVSNY